jgi:hypothetical protein
VFLQVMSDSLSLSLSPTITWQRKPQAVADQVIVMLGTIRFRVKALHT